MCRSYTIIVVRNKMNTNSKSKIPNLYKVKLFERCWKHFKNRIFKNFNSKNFKHKIE